MKKTGPLLYTMFFFLQKVFSFTKILQKSGIQKNEVIELIYRGFI